MFEKYLDPKNDMAFKRIFGTEKNKDILIHFLNDVITCNKRPAIKNVEFLKTSQDPEIASKKTSIVDILCVDEKDTRYIVEMQVANVSGFEKRAMYYAAKAYTSQMEKGGKYHDLKEVIFLAIVDFIMFPGRPGYKSEHAILERESGHHDLKDFSFTFLELPKLKKSVEALSTMTEKWMYFFKNANDLSDEDMAILAKDDGIIKRAYEQLGIHHWSNDQLSIYEEVMKNNRDYVASMDFKFDEGVKKGEENVVQRMLFKGMPVEAISELTGLSMDEVEAMDGTDKKELTA